MASSSHYRETMAPKSSFLSHQPSKDKDESEESSSEEEEEDGREEPGPQSSETDSSDDETEAVSENRPTLENLNSPIPAPKFDPRPASRHSDTDSDGSPSSYVVQPITKGSVSSSKRSRGEIEGDPLRSSKSLRTEEKKPVSTPAGGGGVGCINRLWSNEDEIAVLNGMIEFKIAKGSSPSADMGAFYSFIKGKLKVDFSRDQLKSKITRMKKRYFNALKKGEKGSDPVFSKPHEDMAFVLSKKIWGKSVDVKKKKNLDEDVVDEREIVLREGDAEGGDFWSKYPNINASFDNMKASFPSLVAPVAGMSLLKERLSLIGNVKAKELDDKWKQLLVEKTELDYKILMLMKEQVQMALDQ